VLTSESREVSRLFSHFKSEYIGTRQQSYRSSHAVLHRTFDDVEESEQGERKRLLPRETTTSLNEITTS
jgi:hypothetical protein